MKLWSACFITLIWAFQAYNVITLVRIAYIHHDEYSDFIKIMHTWKKKHQKSNPGLSLHSCANINYKYQSHDRFRRKSSGVFDAYVSQDFGRLGGSSLHIPPNSALVFR